jgi:hypothetical protein
MQIFQIGGGDYQNVCGHLEGKKKLTLKDIFFYGSATYKMS